ncbi:MAG: hypothetical protein PVH19_09595, partial [Planctomycetia bacterium]
MHKSKVFGCRIVWKRILATQKRSWVVATAVMFLALFALPCQTLAVDIVMNLKSSTVYPDYDSDCSKLIALMSNVATYYENIFQDSGALTVNFGYANKESGLGEHSAGGKDAEGHPTSCTILFSAAANWFFDETPFDNSEFNMEQKLCYDLNVPGDYY